MTSQTNNEQLLVRYLLGELPEPEQLRLEERFFLDNELYEQLVVLEEELLYDYVQGRLARRERERFEQRFLTSPQARRQAKSAQALMNIVAESVAAERPAPANVRPAAVPWWQSLFAWVSLPKPALQFSLAALALIVMLGGAWLLSETIRLRTQLGQLQAERATQERVRQQQAGEQRDRSNQLQQDLEREQKERERLAQALTKQQQTRPMVLSLVLASSLVRGDGEVKRLFIPPNADRLRLQLEIKQRGEFRSYLASLRTAEGNELWSQELPQARSQTAGRTVVLNLPARILARGEYELELQGRTAAGELVNAGTYYFNVARK